MVEDTATFLAATQSSPQSANQGTNFAEICDMFMSSLIITWHVPYEKSSLASVSNMVPQWASL